MLKNIITSVITAAIVSVLALGGYSLANRPSQGEALGGITPVLETFGGGIQVGGPGTGTKYALIRSGSTSLRADTSIASSTTGVAYLYLPASGSFTGVRSGDLVRIMLAASTTQASQFVVKSVLATSTANRLVDVYLINLTGAARVPSSVNGFGSSTQYQIFRPITP